MRSILNTGLALVGLVLAAGPALAADIIEPPPFVPPPPPPVVETSGFYLRGDVGYNFKSHGKGEWDWWNVGHDGTKNHHGEWNFGAGDIDRGIDDTYRYDSIKLKGGVSFGAGAGYRFNQFLRTDATFDYFRSDVNGETDCPYTFKNNKAHGYLSDPKKDDCNLQASTKADVWTIMANAYADVPVFGELVVPYVGAGIGTAYVKYDTVQGNEVCTGCPANYVPGSHQQDGFDDWRFAYALMAGATIAVTEQLKIDAGYKYTRIDGGDAWGYIPYDKDHGATGAEARDHGFDIHTVRAGLRYEFGGGSGFGKAPEPIEQVSYEPLPVESEPVFK